MKNVVRPFVNAWQSVTSDQTITWKGIHLSGPNRLDAICEGSSAERNEM